MRVCLLSLMCGACVARVGAVPFMEFPRELVMDVNKAPFPVVNVIVGSKAAGKAAEQESLHQARRVASARRADAQKRRRTDARHASEILSEEVALGNRLRGLASVVRGVASQRQQLAK